MLRNVLLKIAVTMLGVLLAPPMDAAEIGIGIGESRKEGPRAAGHEAAARAKADLGDREVSDLRNFLVPATAIGRQEDHNLNGNDAAEDPQGNPSR